MEIKEILEKLEKGNDNFMNDNLSHKNEGAARRAELVDGQAPFAIILGCADSRVVPELAFDTGLGELFVARVAGNVANISTIASIEYAVAVLKTKVIVVMGHESCGAVGSAIKGDNLGFNLNILLSHITPAIVAAGEGASVNDVVKKNARLTAIDLANRSEILAQAVKDEDLKIVPAYYHLATGKVEFLKEEELS
ncbi:MAG: carbonic anhydrase [Fluviicola sp.]|nr:MAG: carbonic anhydrase [Fluviicola sp.]